MEPAVAERYDRGQLAVRFAGTPGSNLCCALHTEDWVPQVLAPELEVLDLLPGGAPGLGVHDIWTVRKPTSSSRQSPSTRAPSASRNVAS
jgi:hypothetical protein